MLPSLRFVDQSSAFFVVVVGEFDDWRHAVYETKAEGEVIQLKLRRGKGDLKRILGDSVGFLGIQYLLPSRLHLIRQ